MMFTLRHHFINVEFVKFLPLLQLAMKTPIVSEPCDSQIVQSLCEKIFTMKSTSFKLNNTFRIGLDDNVFLRFNCRNIRLEITFIHYVHRHYVLSRNAHYYV